MDDWQALQDGLRAIVAANSGIEAHNIAWDGEPETMRSYPMAMLELVNSARDRSSDETRYELDADGRLVPYVVGNRTITLRVTVKSRDQRGPTKAYVIAERLRTRLELPKAQRDIEALGVALRDSIATQDLSAVSQSREESIAQLTLTLGYVVEERDEDNPEDRIEHVNVSGEVAEAAEGDVITIPEQTMP